MNAEAKQRRRERELAHWSTVDFNRPLGVVAAEQGVTSVTAARYRDALGITPYRVPQKPAKPKQPKQPKTKQPYTPPAWTDGVDWIEQDRVIASKVGVSYQRVQQMRKRLGKPKAIKPSHRWFQVNAALSGKVTTCKAAELSGLSTEATRYVAKKNGFVLLAAPTIRPWDELNWDLPDKTLRNIWRLTDPPSAKDGYGVRAVRVWRKAPKPRWDLRCGQPTDIAYHQARIEEESKAARWFKENAQARKKAR